MICEEVQQTLVALMDGEVTPAERGEIEAHLGRCDACGQELRLLERTHALASRVLRANSPAVDAASDFAALWRRIAPDTASAARSASADAGYRAGRGPTTVRGVGAHRAGGRRAHVGLRRSALAFAGVAAAAGLAVVLYQGASEQPEHAVPSATGPVVAAPAQATRPARLAAADERGADGTRQVARRLADAQTPPTLSERDLQVPDELRRSPGLFVDYPIVRRLDKLQHLEAVMDTPADAPGGGKSS